MSFSTRQARFFRAALAEVARAATAVGALLIVGGGTCAGPGETPPIPDAGSLASEPWAVEVTRFAPGPGAGYGADALPDIVLGAPFGAPRGQGSLDVVSLGREGTIELRLGAPLVDGEGADLVVYENPFVVGSGGPVFAEPGEVAVSADGETWHTWPCSPDDEPPNGCAGFEPVGDSSVVDPLGSDGGGDRFDLRDLGLPGDAGPFRFVRVTDRGVIEASPTAGFDLDAIGVLSTELPDR